MKKLALFFLVIAFISGLAAWFYTNNKGGGGNSVAQNLSDFVTGTGSKNIRAINDFFRGESSSTSTSLATGELASKTELNSSFNVISNVPVSGVALKIETTVIPPAKKGLKSVIEEKDSLVFMQRATGYLSVYDPRTGSVEQITNTTLPGAEEAYFGFTGSTTRLIARYLKDSQVQNYLAKTEKIASSSIMNLTGSNIASGIYSVAISPNKNQFAYLINSGTGSIGYIGDFSGKAKTIQFFSSPFPNWQISWAEKDTILFQTAPSYDQKGLIYEFDLKTKQFKKLLGGLNGLTASLSPNGKKFIYSSSEDNHQLTMRIVGETKEIPLGLNTLPEKCVWSVDSQFIYCAVPTVKSANPEPDSWYQGKTVFTDAFWKIDTSTGATAMIYDPNKTGKSIDGTNLILGLNENNLYLINKQDGLLWKLKVKDEFQIQTPKATTTSASTSTI